MRDKIKEHFIKWYSIYWSVVSTVYLFAITFMEIPEASVRFADTILGFLLGTVISAIIQFFFGSSTSSREKDAVISEMSAHFGSTNENKTSGSE